MSGIAEAKQARATSLRLFTRENNGLLKALENNDDFQIVYKRFEKVEKQYDSVQNAHEKYITLCIDEADFDSETEDTWIEKVEIVFQESERKRYTCENDLKSKAKSLELEEHNCKQEETIMCDKQKLEKELNCAHQLRDLEEVALRNMAKNIDELLQKSSQETLPTMLMEDMQQDFKGEFEKCKEAQTRYVLLLSQEKASEELIWLEKLQDFYLQMKCRMSEFLQCSLQNQKEKQKADHSYGIHLERMKLPLFDGNVRDYPRFKSDFLKHVLPEVKRGSAGYILKSCLKGEAHELVKNMDDIYEDIFRRLDEKYGKVSKVVDVIMNDIKKLKPIKEGDHIRFIEMADIVEKGYLDLSRLGMEKEISTSCSVSVIEEKLPLNLKMKWASLVNASESSVDERDKFPSLLNFLLEQRRILEYVLDNIRLNDEAEQEVGTHHFRGNEERSIGADENHHNAIRRCQIHNTDSHTLDVCNVYLSKTPEERLTVIREKRACWTCLGSGHRSSQCPIKVKCSEDSCEKYHHKSLHQAHVAGIAFHTGSYSDQQKSSVCLLQLMRIKTIKSKYITALFDGGSTISLITFECAKKLELKGTPVKLAVVKVGGNKENVNSYEYTIPLFDKQGRLVNFKVFGIDRISTKVKDVSLDGISNLFPGFNAKDIERPAGEVDLLVGFENASFHPVRQRSSGNLLLMKNQFGACLGGSHHMLKETTEKLIQHVHVHHISKVDMNDFFSIETMGINCHPKCGNCRCGKCPIGGKNYTIKEERELNMIEEGLHHKGDHWLAEYPWLKNPAELPDNRNVAIRIMESTERRLAKNEDHCRMYQAQIDDMIQRGVARKLSTEELQSYKGPIHYISHHDVLKPESKTTPCRIVFNSSASYGGHQLNEYWAKGPDMINNLLGILLRFRENPVALVGDIKKMYHSVKIGTIDQHTHRFVWRNMNTKQEVDTYVLTSVSFGDKPAGTIATQALRKTAMLGANEFPKASDTVLTNSYVDDIIDSVESVPVAQKLTNDMDELLRPGGFEIKEWVISTGNMNLNQSETACSSQKVLGITWNKKQDTLQFTIKMNFSSKRRNVHTGPDIQKENIHCLLPTSLTKRMVLSQINKIYDPLGIVTPVTINAKILMRKLWIGELKLLGWDDPLPLNVKGEWLNLFEDLFELESVEFQRCIRPPGAVGNPGLIVLSDGAEEAFGTCAYIRWQIEDSSFSSYLIGSKCRVSPLKKISIVRLELSGAVLSTRLATFLKSEMRLEFSYVYHIVDSEIVRAMIQKDSYGFSTFVAIRIGEIQESTDPSWWYWVDGKRNIADWTTRGKKAKDIGPNSVWQKGPDFLNLPESEWPIKQSCSIVDLPEEAKRALHVNITPQDTLANRIDITRYSKYQKLIRVTARILSMYQRKPDLSFTNVACPVSGHDFSHAEVFWVKVAQANLHGILKNGKFRRLCPQIRDDGVIVVGSRIESWLQCNYNNRNPILLPKDHQFSLLYAEYIHNQGHLGVSATVSKIRECYWIINLHRIVKSIRYKCVKCKKLDHRIENQIMSPLPLERLKPAPAWTSTSVDLFGPFMIRGQLNKRARGKAYGVIFNCLLTRAVYLDLADDYSTPAFLLVLRRFISIRGSPSLIVSDNGSQLVAASKEMKKVIESLDQKQLQEFGADNYLTWKFTAADAPWQNGCSEALIKSVKRALTAAIGEQVFNFSELLTVIFETSNLINERPIGRHPTDPNDGSYLCPNDLLLGRCTSRIPGGPFKITSNAKDRFHFIQQIVDTFWKKWTVQYFPSLMIRQKWHHDKRNVQVNDVVLIQDNNLVRGQWRMGLVTNVHPNSDGKVRRVSIKYKNLNTINKTEEYKGKGYMTIERPVHRLIVIVPSEETEES